VTEQQKGREVKQSKSGDRTGDDKWKVEDREMCVLPRNNWGGNWFSRQCRGTVTSPSLQKKKYNFTVISAEYDSGCDLDHQTCAKL
jgi:hypothetical protein